MRERFTPIAKDVTGVLQSRQFVALLYLLGGFGGIFASFNLAVDRLILLTSPGTALNCDLSEEVSCGKVDQSWQASLLHFGGVGVPNAMIGLVFYAVLITVGVALFSGVRFPKWFNIATLTGQICMLVFAYWLLSQSFFGLLQKEDDPTLYGALCPWCVMLMTSTTLMTFMLLHYFVLADSDTRKGGKYFGETLGLPEGLRVSWSRFIASYYQYFVMVAWFIIIAVALLVKYKATLLGL